ncbi:MAG: bifunctional UDP-sugar hydrolase/5'-nucleotidase [Elusimicrobia bacterium]|nr:bifunctional UDP-sugar hydrolase/5'-nucleotidase [Elusimicrobiota bacterium]
MRTWACFVLLAAASAAQAGGIKITVLHTSDIHGWVMPRPAGFYEPEPKRVIGGAAALASYVKKVKGPKLVLDAGDWFQGTPEGTIRGGRAVAEIFNAVGYDALTVGNHDFDEGEANLEGLIKALEAPVLCANVYRSDGGRAPEFKPWLVKEVAGVKVGLFGLLNTNMKNLAFPEHIAGLSFRRGVDEAKDAVAALRAQGATVIIALSHQGLEPPGVTSFEADRFLAEQVEGIDLIVGGHSHVTPEKGERGAVHGTLIVQAGSELVRVGEAVLEVDARTKKVVRSSARLVRLFRDQVGSDPAVAKAVAQLSQEVGAVYDVVVGTAAAPLQRSKHGESALGDWITDCEREWAGTDLALQNGGGIRADIAPGPVTLRRLFDVMPFDNRVVKLVMKGKDVKMVLEHGVGMQRIVQISGAAVSFRRQAPEGARLVEVKLAGRDLVDESTYTVATIDFLAQGGDGYAAFDLAESKDFTKTTLRDVLRWCARKSPLIATPAAGRLVPWED